MSNKKQQPVLSLNFTKEMFPEHLNVEEKSVVALYIENFLSGLSPALTCIFVTEITAINNHILPYITNRELYIEEGNESGATAFNIIEQTQKGLTGVIIKYHACAFITSILQFRTYNIDQFNQYKRLVLLCVTRLTIIGGVWPYS